MRRAGIWLVLFGVLSFVLPRFGFDLKWFEYLGGARNWVAVGLIVIGGVLLVLASRRKRASGR